MKSGADKQGQSALATERKQRGLAYAFALSATVMRKHREWAKPYLHIDLNAGNGDNTKFGCDGSPITFMRLFEDVPHFRAIFIDNDAAQIAQLGAREAGCKIYYKTNSGLSDMTRIREFPGREAIAPAAPPVFNYLGNIPQKEQIG